MRPVTLLQLQVAHQPKQLSGHRSLALLSLSLHRLKDSENIDGAFFIFGDVSAKLEGRFALRFNLYEMRGTECVHLQSVLSEPFVVYGAKHFPGMSESTLLTRTFSDQGIRLRLRKEPRSLLRKGGPASDDYVPRSYNRQRNQGAKPELQSGDGDESPESSRHSHSEEGGYVHSQQMLPSSFEQHPQVGHTYSQQSMESFASYEEPMMKRQRTGSEQSQRQSFGQVQTPLEGPKFDEKYSDPHQSAYNQFAQQSPEQPAYGYCCTQSSRSTNTQIDSYFAAHLNTPQEATSPFHPGSRNSSAPGDFTPQLQTPYQQFPYGGQMMPTSSPRSGGPDSFGSMGIADRMQSSPGMGGMSPHDFRFGRMSTSPGLGLLSSDQGYRRGGVGMYGNQNPNISLSMRSDLFEEGPSAAMTTTAPAPAPAPGMMEGL